MTPIAKLTIQGFTFGAALASGACMPQNQNELEQMRAELATLQAEVAALKTSTPENAQAANAAATQQTAEAAGGPSAEPESAETAANNSAADWQAALEQHEKEKRNAAWARLREPALFNLAKEHIKQYGASLNSVRCKETSCLVTINVPKAPKQAYEPLTNPWAEVTMLAHAKPIYAGRTLWSYLLPRHEKDTPEASERVNPLELASQKPELVTPTVVIATAAGTTETGSQKATTASKPKPSTTAAGAKTAARADAPAAQSPAGKKAPTTAAANPASNQAQSPSAGAQAKSTPQSAPGKTGTTTPVAARKSETAPAQPPTSNAPAKPNAEPAENPKASPAGEAKPKSEGN